MLKNVIPTLALSTAAYYFVGVRYAGNAMDMSLVQEVRTTLGGQFHFSPLLLLPLLLIVCMSITKKPAFPTIFLDVYKRQRGGTANCTVKIADAIIGSPTASALDFAITMNEPAIDKFEQSIKPGGDVYKRQEYYVRFQFFQEPGRFSISFYNFKGIGKIFDVKVPS